jgi:hypothetical protein
MADAIQCDAVLFVDVGKYERNDTTDLQIPSMTMDTLMFISCNHNKLTSTRIERTSKGENVSVTIILCNVASAHPKPATSGR